jgi:Ca2+/Na+ antiporter
LQIVAGGRYIRALRNHPADEAVTASETASGTSFLGVTGEEGYSARRLSQEIVDKAGLLNTGKPIQGPPGIGYGSAISTSGAGGYNSEAVAAAAGLTSSPSNGGRMTSVEIAATNNDLLAALDAARSMSLSSSKKKSGIVKEDSRLEIISSRSPNLFAPPSSTSSLHRKADEDDVNVEDDDDESSSRSSYDDEEDEGNDEPETPGGGAGAGSERKGTKDEEEGDGDGDLGGGSGHPSTVVQAPSEEDGGMAATPSKQNKSSKTGAGKAAPDSKGLIKASSGKKSSKKGAKDDGSTPSNASSSSVFMQDLPKKPSRWTRQFLKTQKDLVTTPGPAGGGSGAAAAFQPFQWTRYHKKQLAIELANRLRARGVSMISTPDGRTVDFIDLLTRDPKAAGDLAAAIGTAVTQAAQQQERALSYEEASRAAASGARAALLASAASGRALSTAASIPSGSLLTAAGDASGGYSSLALSETDTTALITTSASGGISGTPATTGAAKTAKSSDYLSILPHETIKPVADCYLRMKRCLQFVYPAWHSFMVIAELPVVVARKLTVPTLHEGAYRRRLLCIVMPFSMAFFVLILTTHILKGSANSESGFPLWMIGFLVGGVVGIALHFILPVKKEHSHPQKEENDGAQVQQSLLSSPGAKAATIITEPAKTSHPHHHHHHQKKRPWYKRLGIAISGPNDHPLPRGVIFGFLMIMSFLLALFWLLVIANEIVGTALFIGKVLSIPDVVMGLTVLAVGNSINDLAASLTIARDGYASMAVAGAYAGPMFNVLAGIGLPMILACSKADSKSYDIGKPTLLTFLAYGALLTSLTVTLVWVPFEQWRITHRIGRFLCAWFFLFVALVVILGFAGVSKGDVVVAG